MSRQAASDQRRPVILEPKLRAQPSRRYNFSRCIAGWRTKHPVRWKATSASWLFLKLFWSTRHFTGLIMSQLIQRHVLYVRNKFGQGEISVHLAFKQSLHYRAGGQVTYFPSGLDCQAAAFFFSYAHVSLTARQNSHNFPKFKRAFQHQTKTSRGVILGLAMPKCLCT